MQELYPWLLPRIFKTPHLHAVLRPYRRDGVVACGGYEGKFAFMKDPWFEFPDERPQLQGAPNARCSPGTASA